MNNLYLVVAALWFISCSSNNSNDDKIEYDSTIVNNLPAPQPITFSIDAVYPHDKQAFTQGLQFYNGKLYEGTGEPNQSTLRIVDIKSGTPEKKYLIKDPAIFGEGVTIFNKKIYQLTWENNKIFVYNLDNIFKPVDTLNWQYPGWGLTNDGSKLIISDGTDKLYYVLPDEEKNNMKLLKILSVSDNRGMVDSLNELEYIDGFVYANRWYTNDIVKIDTANGHVIGKINMTGLLQQYAPTDVIKDGDVLNGIAYDSATKKLYITGKNWPKMFEIKLN
ncbi:MAG: glutaminyl-peptide cyclotransferase [Ginsengibacter sp.]